MAAFHIKHHVTHIQQTDDASCWAAATSMVLGNMTPNGGAANVADGLEGSTVNILMFAVTYGMRALFYNKLTIDVLHHALQWSPVVLIALGNGKGHAFCIGGITGDGSKEKTRVYMNDPANGAPELLSWSDVKDELIPYKCGCWLLFRT